MASLLLLAMVILMKLPMAQMAQMLQYGASERMAIGIKMT